MNKQDVDDSIYYQLRQCLGNMPQGFPSTENKVEIKILKKMFTPEQANIYISVCNLLWFVKARPSNKTLQKKLNLSATELAEKLDKMSKAGLLFRVRSGSRPDDPYYYPPPFIVGLYEFSVNAMDKELADLFNEYKPAIAEWMTRIPTKLLRIVPVESAVQPPSTIVPYNRVEEIIKGHYAIAVSPCACATEQKMLGNTCKAPVERCISFDWFAEYYIDTGLGREIKEEELCSILEMAEEKGLIISPSNTKGSLGLCLCCDCCCTGIKIACSDPSPATQIQAGYLAEIDSDECTQCGLCTKRCNLKAIRINGSTSIDKDKCLGCGLCVATCPENAIKLVDSGRAQDVPEDESFLVLKMFENHIKKNSFNNNFWDKNKLLVKIKTMKSMYSLKSYFSR